MYCNDLTANSLSLIRKTQKLKIFLCSIADTYKIHVTEESCSKRSSLRLFISCCAFQLVDLIYLLFGS